MPPVAYFFGNAQKEVGGNSNVPMADSLKCNVMMTPAWVCKGFGLAGQS